MKIGDVVSLISGGPEMTVVEIKDSEVKCYWFGFLVHKINWFNYLIFQDNGPFDKWFDKNALEVLREKN